MRWELKWQMPVEECGNMLIMIAAALLADGNKKMAKGKKNGSFTMFCWP